MKTHCFLAVAALTGFAVSGAPAEANAGDFEAAAEVLRHNCISCHGEDLQMSGLRLDRREEAMLVIKPGHSDESLLVQRIVDAELGVLMPPDFGVNAATGTNESVLSEEDINTLKAWIDAGALWPEGRTLRDPDTPLEMAQLRGHMRKGEFQNALRLLDSMPELIRMRDAQGATALHAACQYGDADFVGALLDRGAEVNATDAGRLTPLMLAVHDLDMTRLLLQSGADRSAVSGQDKSPLEFAASYSGNSAVLEELLDSQSPPADRQLFDRALQSAVRVLDRDMVRILLDRGGTVDRRTFYYAGRAADPELLESLLESLPDSESQPARDAALAGAAVEGAIEGMRLLLERGADPTAALPSASYSEYSSPTAVELLLEAGADPGNPTRVLREPELPLDMATRRGDPDVIRLLQEAGSDSSSNPPE